LLDAFEHLVRARILSVASSLWKAEPNILIAAQDIHGQLRLLALHIMALAEKTLKSLQMSRTVRRTTQKLQLVLQHDSNLNVQVQNSDRRTWQTQRSTEPL
jgi:hypothetical protein